MVPRVKSHTDELAATLVDVTPDCSPNTALPE
jgi:hypothetical protein